MSKILGAVPGLAGALTMDANQPGTLIQLRITLSASELAMLPFEIAKAPVSTNTAENWLTIHPRPPGCLTRNIRTVSPEGVVWPDQPRILFISGDSSDVPYKQHREALLKAIEPFQPRHHLTRPRTHDRPRRRLERARVRGRGAEATEESERR